MGQGMIPRVEALEVDQSGGLLVGPRPQDTYHGSRYDIPKINGREAYKSLLDLQAAHLCCRRSFEDD